MSARTLGERTEGFTAPSRATGGRPILVRIYTGDDGQSHFEEINGPWALDDRGREQTPWQNVTQLKFSRYPTGYFNDWYTGAHRLYAIILAGQVKCAIGDGTVRRWEPRDVMLEEDLAWQGHTTRVVGGRSALVAFVHLEEV